MFKNNNINKIKINRTKYNKNIPVKMNPLIRVAGTILTIAALFAEAFLVLTMFEVPIFGVLKSANIYDYILLMPVSYLLLILAPPCFIGYIPHFVTKILPERLVEDLPRTLTETKNDIRF